jgi:hypothetical protein
VVDRPGKQGIGLGLTVREREYVRLYKQIYKETGNEAETFRQMAVLMGIQEGSCEQYRYGRPRIKAELDSWKQETFTEKGEMKDEIFSIRVIMQKLQRLYTILEEKGNSRVGDMTDILKTLANLMTKFNTSYEDDLEEIKHITMSDLIKRWSKTYGKLIGNQRAATMMARLIDVKEDRLDVPEVVEERFLVRPNPGKKSIPVVHGPIQVEDKDSEATEEDGRTENGDEPDGGPVESGTAQSGDSGDAPKDEVNVEERTDPVDGTV